MSSIHPLAPNEVLLRLLQTTDVHVHLLAYDYFAERDSASVGLSRTATLIKDARVEVTNSLLFDTGDFLQGNLLGDRVARYGANDLEIHPAISAMNALRYDAATLGNHEFGFGLDFLLDTLVSARFPLVLANVARKLGPVPSQDQAFLNPYRIVEKQVFDASMTLQKIRVGYIGFVPPQSAVWDRHNVDGQLYFRDIVESAQDYVPQMKDEGADLIIALSHSGIDAAGGDPMSENASLSLAGVEGIDVVLCGHQHRRFPGLGFTGIAGVDPVAGTLHGKPAVMAGFWGSHLGLIDLVLHKTERGGWELRRHKSELRAIASDSRQSLINESVDEAPEVVHAVHDHHNKTLAYMKRSVGRTMQPLHSFFSMVASDRAMQLVARAQADFVSQALAHSDFSGLPILSAAAPFKAGGRAGPSYFTNVPEGTLTIRSLADLYLFPNSLCAVRMTGEDVADWLERVAALFQQITLGEQDQELHQPEFASYNFDHVLGITYEIDPSQPARYSPHGSVIDPDATRISKLNFQGQPIDPKQQFIVATNSFRASGGGGFKQFSPDKIELETQKASREILEDYIVRQKHIYFDPEPLWQFKSLANTSALFKTAPEAINHLSELQNRAISPAGASEDGFTLMRLSF